MTFPAVCQGTVFVVLNRNGFASGGNSTPSADEPRSAKLRIAVPQGCILQGGETRSRSMSLRPIKRLVQAKPTLEGAGVRLRRAFGFGNTSDFDPFLLLDDFRNDVPKE